MDFVVIIFFFNEVYLDIFYGDSVKLRVILQAVLT